MGFRKFVKKVARKGVKYARKRYVKKTVGKSIHSVIRDVARLKAVLNPELKRNVIVGGSSIFGQCSVNANAYYFGDITPVVGTGTSNYTRNGNSIKHHKMEVKLQFIGQLNNDTPTRFRYFFFTSKGSATSMVSADVSKLLSVNPFSGLYDFNCDRNDDQTGDVSVIKTGTLYLPSPTLNLSGATTIKNLSTTIYFKNRHVVYTTDTNTVNKGFMYLAIFADSGNIGSTASTLTNIPVLGSQSGCILNSHFTHYFYDN